MGRILLPLLPLQLHAQIYSPLLFSFLPLQLLSSAHDHLRLPPMSRLHVSVAEICTAYCARSSDELTIQHVFRDAPISHSMDMDMAKPSQTPLA